MTRGTRRACRAVAAALLVVLAGACGSDAEGFISTTPASEAPDGGEPPADAEERIERAIFDHVDDERRARGLTPFEWDDQLAEQAADWSAVWATQRFGRLTDGPPAGAEGEAPPEEPVVTDEGRGPACPGDLEVELEDASSR